MKTMKTLAEKISVMQAFERGEKIEIQGYISCEPFPRKNWYSTNDPQWNWVEYDYRVAREPRRIWVNFTKSDIANVFRNKESAESSFCSGETVEFVEVMGK